MITEDYVSFETAKLLKEKGFDEFCRTSYGPSYLHNGVEIDEDEEFELKCEGKENEIEIEEGGTVYAFWNQNHSNDEHVYSRPTLAFVMQWLREVYNLHISIDVHFLHFANKLGWMYIINRFDSTGVEYVGSDGDTYEQACEAAIKYCLENLI